MLLQEQSRGYRFTVTAEYERESIPGDMSYYAFPSHDAHDALIRRVLPVSEVGLPCPQ